MQPMLSLRPMFKIISWYIAFIWIAALGMLFVAFPSYPSSMISWIWFLTLALPIALAGDLLIQFIFQRKTGRPSNSGFHYTSLNSLLRALLAFVVLLAISGLVWLLTAYSVITAS